MDANYLIAKTIKWGEDRGIDNMWTQAAKVTEEWGETVREMTHNRFGAEFEDGLGDTLITLIIYAHICGKDIVKCLNDALEEVNGRTGKTVDGNFIKDPDS